MLLPSLAVAQDAPRVFPTIHHEEQATFASRDAFAAGEPNGFLFSLETSARLSDPAPLSGTTALGVDSPDAAPALVPLAPPLWAGLALLGALALARTKQSRRRARTHTA